MFSASCSLLYKVWKTAVINSSALSLLEEKSIGRFNNLIFEGPYNNTEKLRHQSGIYIIICRRGSKNHIIDVGECNDMRSKIEICAGKNIWAKYGNEGSIVVAAHYTPKLQQTARIEIENKIRENYSL